MSGNELTYEEIFEKEGLENFADVIMDILKTKEDCRDKVDQNVMDKIFCEETFKSISETNEDFEWEDELDEMDTYKELFVDMIFKTLRGGKDKELLEMIAGLELHVSLVFPFMKRFGTMGEQKNRKFKERLESVQIRDNFLIKLLLTYDSPKKLGYASKVTVEKYMRDEEVTFPGRDDEIVSIDLDPKGLEKMLRSFRLNHESFIDEEDKASISTKSAKINEIESQFENVQELINEDNFDLNNMEGRLDIDHEMDEVRIKMIPENVENQMQKYLKLLEKDLKLSGVPNLSESELLESFKNSNITKTYILENGILKQKEDLNNLVSSKLTFEFSKIEKTGNYQHPTNALSFSGEDSLQKFLKSCKKYSYFFNRYSSRDRRSLQMAGVFDMANEWETVWNQRKSQKVDLIEAKVIKHLEQTMRVKVEDLVISDKVLEEMAQLSKSNSFEESLRKLENKYGSVFEVGKFYLGGTFMIVGKLKGIKSKQQRKAIQMIRSKLNTETAAKIYEANTCKIDLSNKKEHYVDYGKHEEIFELFNRVKTKYHWIGRDQEDIETYQCFANRVLGTNKSWKVVQQDLQMMYLADFLTLPKSLDRLRAKGLTTEMVLKLKRKMWESFNKRTNGVVQSQVRDDWKVFTEEEIQQMKEKIKKDFMQQFERKFKEIPKIPSKRDDEKKEYLKWKEIEKGIHKIRDILKEVVEWQDKLSKETPPEKYMWDILKSNDKDIVKMLKMTQTKLYPLIKMRVKEFTPDKEQRDIENDHEYKQAEECLKYFLKIWHKMPEDFNHVVAVENDFYYFWFMMRKQIGVKEEIFEQVRRVHNKRIHDELRDIPWNDLLGSYKKVRDDYHSASKKGEPFDLKKKMNYYLKKVASRNVFRDDMPEDLTHRLCAMKMLDLPVDRMLCIKAPTIEQVENFCNFYEKNKKSFLEKLVPRTHFFEHWMGEIFKKNFDSNDRERQKFQEFCLFVMNRKFHIFNSAFMMEYVYSQNERHSAPIQMKTSQTKAHLKKCLKIFNNLSKIKKTSKESNPKGDSNFDPVRERAKWLCKGESVIQYSDAMEIRLRFQENEIQMDDDAYKKVFDQLLARNPLRKLRMSMGARPGTLTEHALALYYLADDNLRRVLSLNFFQANSPVPFLYPNSKCFFSPFNSIQILSKDKNGEVTPSNPFFMPSLKVLYLQTQPMTQKIEKIMNMMYWNGGHYFTEKDKKEGSLENGMVYAGIFSNHFDPSMCGIAEFNLALLLNKWFTTISTNERFLLSISRAVVLLRKEEDEDKFKMLYNFVKLYNSDPKNKHKKVLVDIIQCDNDNEKTTRVERRIYEKNLLRLYVDNRAELEHYHIAEFLKFHKYNEQLTNNLTSLKEDAEDCREMGIEFDVFESNLGDVWYKIYDLIENLDTQNDGKILKLQDSLYKNYQKNRKNLLDSNITKNLESNNKLFQDNMKRVRLKQLEYIANLSEDSPVIKVMQHLFSLDDSRRLTYLFYLESYLDKKQIKDIFEVDQKQHLQTVNFFREIGQIYEVVEAFLESFEDDPEISGLNPLSKLTVLPKLAAELFWNFYPAELINGDLTVIPIKWMEAFFNEVISHPKNFVGKSKEKVKIKTLTMIGTQNSGKSTFLNTLFNFNFRVSNGRTTRGSKIIILPMNREFFKKHHLERFEDYHRNGHIDKKEIATEREFCKKMRVPDYIMIVDTEGLGGIDMYAEFVKMGDEDQMNVRDNRMVLFNTGFSDFTIVNSMREFNERIVNILTMLMYSYSRLIERKVVPLLNLVFQDRDFNQYQYDHLWKVAVDTLITMHGHAQDLNPSLPDFYDLLRFNKRSKKDLMMIPGMGTEHNYHPDYMRKIEEYKQMIFYRHYMMCGMDRPQDFTFENLKKKISMLYRCVTFERENFNSHKLESLQRKRIHNLFLIKLRRGVLNMFEQRFEKFSIKDTDDLRKNESNLKENIKRLDSSSNYDMDCLRNYYKRAMDNKFLREGEDMDSPKVQVVVDEAFQEMLEILRNKNELNKLLNKNEDVEEEFSKIKSNMVESLKNQNLGSKLSAFEIYQKLEALFEEKFKKMPDRIKEYNRKMKQIIRNKLQVQDQTINMLRVVTDSKMERYINENVRSVYKDKSNQFKLARVIDDYIIESDFENFPKFLNETAKLRSSEKKGGVLSLRQEHRSILKNIQKTLAFDYIFKDNKVDYEPFENLIKEFCEKVEKGKIFEQKWSLGDLPKEFKAQLPQKLQEETSQGRMNLYSAYLVYYCIFVLNQNVDRGIKEYVDQIDIWQKFKSEERFKIIFEALEGQGDLVKLYFLVQEEVRSRAQKGMDDYYVNLIDQKMPSLDQLGKFVRETQIKFLEKSKKVRKGDSNGKIKFVEEVKSFGLNFVPFLKSHIEQVIEENLEENDEFKKQKKEEMFQATISIKNAIEDETTNESTFKELKEMFKNQEIKKYIGKTMKKPQFGLKNKNELNKLMQEFGEYLEKSFGKKVHISVAKRLRAEYLRLKFSLTPCPGCGMKSTTRKSPGESISHHTYEFHIPPLFRGIFSFISDNNFLPNLKVWTNM